MCSLNIDGNMNITGAYKVYGTTVIPLNITTTEQPTGEKFFGLDVYVKG
jgi:hypothetical protein